MTDLIHFGQNN